MKKRLICLFLCIFMIIPVLAGCADKTDDQVNADITDKASESTVTVTMYLMTDQDVCTAEELAAIKTTYGAKSPEYTAAKYVFDAHKKVEVEMNKITKAKFKTQVNVFWLTPDEYYDIIETKIENFEKDVELKADAKKAWDKFRKEQAELGATNEYDIKKLFDEKYPEYAKYIEIKDPDETTAVTEEETIRGESGIIELKYPEPGENQVDIIYIGGYDLYLKYIENEWLEDLGSELTSTAKSLNAYINAAFFDAMKANPDGGIYAIPTNRPIGDYTYMLLSKELYDDYYEYYGLHDDIQKEISSIADIYEFIEEVGQSDYLSDWVPFTGLLQTSGMHFWSTDYEYVLQEGLSDFVSGKAYYVKDETGAYSQVGKYIPGVQYFVKDSTTQHYGLHAGVSLDPATDYFILSPEAYTKASEFVSGVTYFTKDAAGNYIVAEGITAFESDVTYYRISNQEYVKIDTSKYTVSEGVVFYTKVDKSFVPVSDITEFDKNTDYYVIRDKADEENESDVPHYVEYGAFEEGVEYYIAEITFNSDDFSILGSAVEEDADEKTKLNFENVFTGNFDYADQLLAIKKIQENGFYDAKAIEDGKKFAAAIVKGGADVAAKYADDYFAVVIDAPVADFGAMYENMFAVSKATSDLTRSMEIITLLNTDPEFRNLVQYGIEGENYDVKTVEIDGKKYPKIERLNKHYMMDINKTGNLFVAYPEENMSPNVWDFGKIQNRDSRRAPLSAFDINSLTSPDLDLLIALEAISDEWKAKLDACKTSEELVAVIDQIKLKTATDENLKRLTSPAESDSMSLNIIYNEWYTKTNSSAKK